MDDGPQTVILILISLLLSAFFSGVELAFVSANKLKIEMDRKQGLFSGQILTFFAAKNSRFFAVLRLGNIASLTAFALVLAHGIRLAINPYIPYNLAALILQIIITALLVFIAVQFLPKAFFRINPNRKLQFLVVPILISYALLVIPALIIMGLSQIALRLVGVRTKMDHNKLAPVDLDHFMHDFSEHTAVKNDLENEIEILKNALDFSKVKAKDCLIPRTEIEAVDIDDSIDELHKRFIETGYSKILIFNETIDNIIGYVHAFELFRKPSSIRGILLPVFIVPESVLVKDLLPQFTKNKRSVALVVDEFGGTAGILTIEDIIEEIFGEIDDEHDVDEEVEKKLDETTYLFAGRLEIDYLNKEYDLNIEESDDYETLAGFVIHHLESIPAPNTIFETDQFVITVVAVSEAKIDLIKVRVKD
jgi:putative hemolysin